MNYKHGMTHSRTWNTWKTMTRRCRGANDKAVYYADRGITVCAHWMDFSNFLADMGERPEGMTLDRIDNSKGYEPGNCRWASHETQMQNTRRNVHLTVAGETKCLAEWERITGIQRQTIRKRLKLGWTPEMAIRPEKWKRSAMKPPVQRKAA